MLKKNNDLKFADDIACLGEDAYGMRAWGAASGP